MALSHHSSYVYDGVGASVAMATCVDSFFPDLYESEWVDCMRVLCVCVQVYVCVAWRRKVFFLVTGDKQVLSESIGL